MSDERFARQYHFEPPPGFRLASSCTGIVHYLSGPIGRAPTQTALQVRLLACVASLPGGWDSHNRFRYAARFYTLRLAHTIDSLVRVSRRVVGGGLKLSMPKQMRVGPPKHTFQASTASCPSLEMHLATLPTALRPLL